MAFKALDIFSVQLFDSSKDVDLTFILQRQLELDTCHLYLWDKHDASIYTVYSMLQTGINHRKLICFSLFTMQDFYAIFSTVTFVNWQSALEKVFPNDSLALIVELSGPKLHRYRLLVRLKTRFFRLTYLTRLFLH